MTTLSTELRETILRRVQQASVPEILAITSHLCGNESPAPQPVRDASESRFTVMHGSPTHTGLDTVFDRSTGLIWTRGNVPGGQMNWKDAQAAAAALRIDGATDWRLPTIKELLTLVDYDRHDPAINTEIFDCEKSWYWASTPAAYSPGDCAWFVNFSYGGSDWRNQGNSGFVRACRASQ